jgi:hypothetical protein
MKLHVIIDVESVHMFEMCKITIINRCILLHLVKMFLQKLLVSNGYNVVAPRQLDKCTAFIHFSSVHQFSLFLLYIV